MSERAPRPERLVALFVTVFWAAVVFAVDGLLAVVLDRDPVQSDDVGPYFSILAFVVAGVLLWLLLSGTSTSRNPVWGAVAAVALVYLTFLGVALVWGLALVADQALSPFVIAASLLAGAAVVATWAAIRSLRWRQKRR
jgi:hypothetical protein